MLSATQAYAHRAAQSERDSLITAHLPLVRHVLGKIIARVPAGMDRENLEAAGALGLVDAANRFDAKKGIKFKTYAYIRIRGSILDELRRNCPLPQHVFERVTALRQVQEELCSDATLQDLAQATGWTEEEVSDCLLAMRIARTTSLDGTESSPATEEAKPEARTERAEEKARLAEAIAALPDRERLVVTLYYLEDLRLREIAQVLQLSESRVSRILSAALGELRECLTEAEA